MGYHELIIKKVRGIPGGPVVKTSPSDAEDTSLSPGQGTKTSHAVGQPATTEPMDTERAHM